MFSYLLENLKDTPGPPNEPNGLPPCEKKSSSPPPEKPFTVISYKIASKIDKLPPMPPMPPMPPPPKNIWKI